MKLKQQSRFSSIQVAKKVLLAAAISSTLVLGGCKDGSSENKEEAARFTRSATTYQEQGQYRAAMLEAKNAIQKDPKNPDGYILLARIYNQVGAYASTQKMLESVIKKMPSVSLELADAYVSSKKFRSAVNVLSDFDISKASADDQARAQVLIARSQIHLGDKAGYEQALAALQKIPGKQDDAIFIESEYLVSQGRAEEAQTKLDTLDITNVKNVKTLITLGNFAMQRNQLSKAEDFYTKALGLLPNTDVFTVDKTMALAQLTESLIQQGRTSEAYRYQKILAEANPESQQAQQKFNDAMELYRQSKFDEASKLLSEIREQFPQDKNSAMLMGLVQYQQGQDQQASELFDKFIDPETATPTVIQAAALAKYRSNKMDEALALLKKSVESQPDNAEILATYGLALLDKDPTSSEAERALEKSLALNPKQQRLRLALAKRHMAMKNQAQAIAQLQKAYSENPQDLIIQETYFKALFADGKLNEVKKEVAEFQKAYPTNARGAFLEGWYKMVEKDYAGAQAAFEKALSTKGNTEKVLSYSGLAQLYTVQKQPQKALSTWQDLLQEDPTQVPAYSQWLRLVQELKRTKEAQLFLQGLEDKSDKWQPSVVMAQLLFSQGQVSESIAHIDKALERSNNAAQVKQIAANLYHGQGNMLARDNKFAEAKTYLLKALTFFPSNMNYLASLIELEIKQKNIPEAQKLLDQFSGSEDVAAEHDYLQAVIRNAEGKPDDALKLYFESWNKKPMDASAEAIFSQYQATGKKELANKFVDEWVTKLPNSPRPALIKAVDAQQKNDSAEAIKWYEKTVALAPQLPAALNNLAWLYYEQKNPKSVELAKKAYDLAGSNPPIMDTYGWILVENNRVAEGIDILERAANLSPNNKEIVDHLKQAKARLK